MSHKNSLHYLWRCVLVVVLTVAGLGALATPVAAQSPLPPWYAAWQEINARAAADVLVVRVYYGDAATLQKLAAQNEPWEVNRAEGYAIFDVTRAGYDDLIAAGLRVEVDAKLTGRLRQPNVKAPNQVNAIPGYPCYRTVEETFAAAVSLTDRYPTLATWNDIGDSWEKSTAGGLPGYDLMVLRITNAAIPGPKPKLFAASSIHAREYAPAELNLRFAEYLLENYGTDPDVTWIVDYHEVHLLLQANPDGRKQAETGLSWRKNTNENYCGATSTSRGADLNRNFTFQWGCCGGSSGSPCADTYRGPTPSSEPEVQTFQNYVRSQYPDLRADDLNSAAPLTTTGIFLDLHSYSELVLWSWGFTANPAPNASGLQTLGRKMAYFSQYTPQQSMDLYATDGTTDDFAYGELGLPAYTIEMGTDFFQPCDSFDNTIYPDNLQTLLYTAKVVRTPYLLPSGPDAVNVAVSTVAVEPGEPVTLTATLDDTRYQNSNGAEPSQAISTARYSVDTPPWTVPAPTFYALTPADGAFNTSVEAARAVVNTAGLGFGRHTLFVQSQDASGNWGPVSAAFLYILDPVNDPVISGYVRAAGSQAALPAVVSAGAFATSTDPATGYYTMRVISDTYTLQAQSAGYGISTTTPITLQQGQSLQQNFYLYPECTLWDDDVESGAGSWSVTGAWAISTESSHSSTHAWSDSPNGEYANNVNIMLTSPQIDLSEVQSVVLDFWHTYDLETDYDYGYVEYSTNNGATWNAAASFNGEGQTTWQTASVALNGLAGQTNARFRFRLETDISVTADGWHIDDIALSGAGPACLPPQIAPTADFANTTPTVENTPITFTSSAFGTAPLYYTWDFGDGSGTATTPHPIHTYTSSGVFTVTLLVTNSLGSAQASHPVTVTPAIQWAKNVYVNAVLTGDNPVPVVTGDVVTVVNRVRANSLGAITATLAETYPAALSPVSWNVTAGIVTHAGSQFTWQLGAFTPQTWYTLSVGYQVLGGPWDVAALDDHLQIGGEAPVAFDGAVTFRHLVPQMVVTPQSIQATAHPGERITRTLTVRNTGDADLTWTLAEQPPSAWLSVLSNTLPLPDVLAPGASRVVSLALDAAGLDDGAYTAAVQVTGDDPATPAIPVGISLTVCTAPAGVAFTVSPSAPRAGDVVTFSGNLAAGTPPLAWSWTLGDGAVAAGQTVTHTYAVSGTYPVTLTVTNACGSASASRSLAAPGQAALTLQPEAIAKTVPPGSTGTAAVQVRNTGTAALTWTVAAPAVAWLDVTPQAGAVAPGASVPVTLSFAATALPNGQYTTTLSVAANDPERPVVTLPVTLTVACIPATGVTLRQITAGDLFTDTLVAFEADLLPAALTPYSYTLNGGAVHTGESNPLSFNLTFNTVGAHTVELSLWNCPAHSPVSDSLPVFIRERAAHMVVVAPPPAAPVYPGDMYTQTLVVSNTGSTTLTWSLAAQSPVSWLSAAPDAGALAPQTAAAVTLSVDAAGMQPGSHTATLVVAGNDPQRPQVSIPLTLTVLPRPLTSAELRVVTPAPIYTDTLVAFEAHLLPANATTPFTYTLDDGAPQTITAPTFEFTRTFPVAGVYTVTLAAWNDAITQPVTATATVESRIWSGEPRAITTIAATREPSAGALYTDTLITWTVTLLPLDAARPYTYTLDGGLPLTTTENTVSFTRTGETTGAHAILFAAWNPVMAQPLTQTLAYEIVARPSYNSRVYLPIVLR